MSKREYILSNFPALNVYNCWGNNDELIQIRYMSKKRIENTIRMLKEKMPNNLDQLYSNLEFFDHLDDDNEKIIELKDAIELVQNKVDELEYHLENEIYGEYLPKY